MLVCLVCVSHAESADVSFRNDVMQVLSKAGCNLGTCHGNARGKGGFQISLRGQDPTADYAVLTHDLFGRRANTTDPDQSLLLLKPTMQLAHEGGRRFRVDSPEYQILRDWISAGLPNDVSNAPTLVRLDVSPTEIFLDPNAPSASTKGPNSGWQHQILATAHFSDGSNRDVTSLAVYDVAQPVATVSHDGLVTGQSAGETAVLVRYLNLQVPVRFAFLKHRPDFAWSGPEPTNLIDRHVFAKLRKLRINPSPVCDDSTFVRRVTYDLLGFPPTSDEARQFVNDPSPDKRKNLINSLLERPEFADWWAMKWADLLRIEEKTLDPKGVESFHAWLRDAFNHNKPLDQFTREIVTGRGSTYEVPPANFYRALRTPFERSEAVGQLFLGVRLQCSKCHNHPFDKWTQDDYYSWGSVFARVDYKILENRRGDNNDQHEFNGEQIVFLNDNGKAKDPRTNNPRDAQFLGDDHKLGRNQDPLSELGNWLPDPHHERFVQVMANRIWQQVVGRGIVEPVDDFRDTNPPSNPELLKALADELASGPVSSATSSTTVAPGEIELGRPKSHAFDLKHLLRVILYSQTYQHSSDPNPTNAEDESNFSRAVIKRHSAEQLLDAIGQSLNVPLEFSGFPSGRRASQLPGVGALRSRRSPLTDADRFLRLFGKPPRLQSCDCERSDETTLSQTFQLVSGDLINRMLRTKQNRLTTLIASAQPKSAIVNELYWSILSRAPSDDEMTSTTSFLDGASDSRGAIEDLAWALFNSNEFLLRR